MGAAPMLDGGASRMEDGRCNTWDTGCDYVCDYVVTMFVTMLGHCS